MFLRNADYFFPFECGYRKLILLLEMTAFGWWFISGCFEDNWALEHLYKSLLRSGGDMEPKFNTLDRLSTLVDKHKHCDLLH